MSLGDIDRHFGFVFFDDHQDPGSGWCATAPVAGKPAQPARRIMGPNELSTDTIWWTNITYEHFFKRLDAFRNPNLRHDKYLVVSWKDVLREWGHDPDTSDASFVSEFCSKIFDKVMRMVWSLKSEVNPKLRIEECFTGKTLREDMRSLLPEMEYPKGPAAAIMKSGHAWEEFTATVGVRSPKGSKMIVLRQPRISYAMKMLQTPFPRGPFEFKGRGDLKSDPLARVALVKNLREPAMVEVTINSFDPEIAPIYGFGAAIDKDKRVSRSWVAHNEFCYLHELNTKLDVRSIYQGREYWAMVPEMQEAVTSFLSSSYTELSWSAGIVAETLWRTVALNEDKSKAGPLRDGEDRAQTSWPGAWIRAADKAEMFDVSMKLTRMGYAVSSFGLGWVRCSVADEEIPNLIRDGLTLGVMPLPGDVPDNAFPQDRPIPWSGDPKSKNMVYFTLTKDLTMLWNLDKVPLIPNDRRAGYITELRNHHSRLVMERTRRAG